MVKLTLLIALWLGLCGAAWAAGPDASVTYTLTGTMGPLLVGSDPAGADGGKATITITASSTAKPVTHNAGSATYKLPPGAVTIMLGGGTFTTTSDSKLKINFPKSGPNSMVVISPLMVNGFSTHIVGKASLASGSFSNAVLQHPTPFAPSTQTLSSAGMAPGPGSTLHYSLLGLGSKTILGLTGTATAQ